MKAHVVTDDTGRPALLSHLTNEDWEEIHDLIGGLEELDIVSGMSLDAAVFALQQIELHLGDVEDRSPLAELFKGEDRTGPPVGSARARVETLEGVISRIRILVTTTLVSLGVLGDLETGEDGLPLPVELPNMGIEEQQATLRTLTAERSSGQEPS